VCAAKLIDQVFDALSYQKGASVIRMLEGCVCAALGRACALRGRCVVGVPAANACCTFARVLDFVWAFARTLVS
jgi:hypothetical protein